MMLSRSRRAVLACQADAAVESGRAFVEVPVGDLLTLLGGELETVDLPPHVDGRRMAKILVDVVRERESQEAHAAREQAAGRRYSTCADPYMPGGDDVRLAVLVEEVGEVARAILDRPGSRHGVRGELVQVAAVAVAWLESVRP